MEFYLYCAKPVRAAALPVAPGRLVFEDAEERLNLPVLSHSKASLPARLTLVVGRSRSQTDAAPKRVLITMLFLQ